LKHEVTLSNYPHLFLATGFS